MSDVPIWGVALVAYLAGVLTWVLVEIWAARRNKRAEKT